VTSAASGDAIIVSVALPAHKVTKKLKFAATMSAYEALVLACESVRRTGHVPDGINSHAFYRNGAKGTPEPLDLTQTLGALRIAHGDTLLLLPADRNSSSSGGGGDESETRARNRRAVLDEIVSTESDYVGDLRIVIESVLVPTRAQSLLTANETTSVFRNIEEISVLHGSCVRVRARVCASHQCLARCAGALLTALRAGDVRVSACSGRS
jgi:hypothetical protein